MLRKTYYTSRGSELEFKARLNANDSEYSDEFGRRVSISGEYAIVSANHDDDNGEQSGSAYIFEKQDDGSWIQSSKLNHSDDGEYNYGDYNYFGSSVSISGEYAGVGTSGKNSAYIFKKQDDDSWIQTSKITTSSNQNVRNIHISGDYSFVSDVIGSIYILKRNNDDSWTQTYELITSDESSGSSISVSGKYAIISSNSESAYIFKKQDDDSWIQTSKLTASDGNTGDFFGTHVSISGKYAVIGAHGYEKGSGSAYIFQRNDDDSWTQTSKLTASDSSDYMNFGVSGAISEDYAIIGSRYSGSSYVFQKQDDGSWIQKSKLKLAAFKNKTNANFGVSISISGDNVIIGSPLYSSHDNFYPGSGSAYIFDFKDK